MSPASGDQALAGMALASRLREARRSQGLSQSEVARRAGLSRVAISEIESGRRKVSSLELASLARLFGRDPQYFLGPESQDTELGAPATVTHLARTAQELTPQDQEQLLRFAQYLRQQGRRNPDQRS